MLPYVLSVFKPYIIYDAPTKKEKKKKVTCTLLTFQTNILFSG